MSVATEHGYRPPASEATMPGLVRPAAFEAPTPNIRASEALFGASDLVKATDHIGHYMLRPRTLLKEGSTSIVVAAEDAEAPLGEDPFVLKVINRTGRQAFDHARRQAEIAHRVWEAVPFVPQVGNVEAATVDVAVQIRGQMVNVHGEVPVIPMEFVQGKDLAEVVDEKGKLGVEDTVELLRPVAAVLDTEHGMGIVHRDVNLHNIVTDRYGNAKVIDFDSAFEGETVVDDLEGTPGHMAPEEQVLGGRVTEKVDSWKIAAVAAELMTGERLIPGETVFANMDVCADEATYTDHITNELKDLPYAVRAVLLDGLAHDPEHRPTPTQIIERLVAAARFETAPTEEELFQVDAPRIAPVVEKTPKTQKLKESAQRLKGKAGEIFKRNQKAEVVQDKGMKLEEGVNVPLLDYSDNMLLTQDIFMPIVPDTASLPK